MNVISSQSGRPGVRFLRDVLVERGLWITFGMAIAMRIAFAAVVDRSFVVNPKLMQLLDFRLLQDEPLTSLYYLHMQPPLFNGLLAVALALPDGLMTYALAGCFLALSFAMIAVVYFFLRRWEISAAVATGLATLFAVSPSLLLYENVFFYSHVEAFLALVAMYFAATYASARHLGSFVGFAACLAMLALVRSMFHLGWVAVALLAVWWSANPKRPRDTKALAVGIASLLVVGSVYAKNHVEFGFFGASSWLGLHIADMSLPMQPSDLANFPELRVDVRKKAEAGEISASAKLMLDAGWHGYLSLPAKSCDEKDRPTVLCSHYRSDGGVNWNHRDVIRYSADLARDARVGLRSYPTLYLRHAASSVLTFLGTPSWHLDGFGKRISPDQVYWDRLLLYDPSRVFSGGRLNLTGTERVLQRLGAMSLPLTALVLLTVSIVLACGAADAWRAWRGEPGDLDWIFPAIIVALLATVPHLLNGIESNRMRYTIEPILFLALARGGKWFADSVIRRSSGTWRSR